MITSDMEILSLVHKYPETEEVFRKYDNDAGCCVLCDHLFDTLLDLAGICGINVKKIIEDIEAAVFIRV